jgi:hypothetical protein
LQRITVTSSAAIPYARIVVAKQLAGAVVRALSNCSGRCTVPELNLGTRASYVGKTGFRHVEISRFQLLAQQTIRLNDKFEARQIHRIVQVFNNALVIAIENQAAPHPITHRRLRERSPGRTPNV